MEQDKTSEGNPILSRLREDLSWFDPADADVRRNHIQIWRDILIEIREGDREVGAPYLDPEWEATTFDVDYAIKIMTRMLCA